MSLAIAALLLAWLSASPAVSQELGKGQCMFSGADFSCDARIVSLDRLTGKQVGSYAPAGMMASLAHGAKFRCSDGGKNLEVLYTECSETEKGTAFVEDFSLIPRSVVLSLPGLAPVKAGGAPTECVGSATPLESANSMILSGAARIVDAKEGATIVEVPIEGLKGPTTRYQVRGIGMLDFIGKKLYCQLTDGTTLECFDLVTKKKLWQFSEKFRAPLNEYAIRIYQDGGTLFIATSPFGVYAAEAASGKILWKAPYYSNGMSASYLLTTHDRVILAPAVRRANLMQCQAICPK